MFSLSNIKAAVLFYEKHSDDIAKLRAQFPKGDGDPTLANDVIGLINKHKPEWNPNGVLNDALVLVRQITAPTPAAEAPLQQTNVGA
jgi:hypothetical protein